MLARLEYVNWLESILQGAPASRNQVLASAWRRDIVADTAPNIIDFETRYKKRELARAAEEEPPFHIIRRAYVAGFEFKIVDKPNRARTRASGACERRQFCFACFHHTRANGRLLTLLHLMICQRACKISVKPMLRTVCRTFGPASGIMSHEEAITLPLCERLPEARWQKILLSEVGCPYAVRGFDYDYVGILWLDDLIWRGHHWEINAATVPPSASPARFSHALTARQ